MFIKLLWQSYLFTLRIESENKQRSSSKIDPICVICPSLPQHQKYNNKEDCDTDTGTLKGHKKKDTLQI